VDWGLFSLSLDDPVSQENTLSFQGVKTDVSWIRLHATCDNIVLHGILKSYLRVYLKKLEYNSSYELRVLTCVIQTIYNVSGEFFASIFRVTEFYSGADWGKEVCVIHSINAWMFCNVLIRIIDTPSRDHSNTHLEQIQ
jgi:hypothetical protein